MGLLISYVYFKSLIELILKSQPLFSMNFQTIDEASREASEHYTITVVMEVLASSLGKMNFKR